MKSPSEVLVGDMTLDVGETREGVIALRNKALIECDFPTAVLLSHTIALLAALIERLEKENEG